MNWRCLISIVALCACVQTSSTPVEPVTTPEPEPEPEPAPSFDARPLDPEIAALLAPEALAAAAEAAKPKPPQPDLRTPIERGRERCESRCAEPFDRDAMIRRLTHVHEKRGLSADHHGLPPELSDEDGLRRFINGEPSTIYYLDGDPSGIGYIFALYINPDMTRATFPFHGLLFEIDADARVVRCRYAERGDPDAVVDMACPR